MTNREKIQQKLKHYTELNINKKSNIGVTANEIAESLGLQRNVVSHYLNELCKLGVAIKTNTRPVYFWDTEMINNLQIEEEEDENKDPFIDLIGADGSLKDQVEQCKAAAIYPNNGLPITLTGDSGVGKSYIASLIHQYAIYKECIKEKSPLVTFNCADYANNPELLSANLFGYKKGAFTGADKDTPGLIEAANGGYLFLDEVHRLGNEGQEKLFLFLDQGKFRRLGETDKWRSANVRFIFATTENLDEVLLDTFRRRIPVFVDIPSLDKRTISERLNMIYNFYLKESNKIDKDLIIHKNVVNALLSIKGKGNIGLLKNIIVSSCANAYRNNLDIEDGILQVNTNDISSNFKNSFKIEKNVYHENLKVIRKEDKYRKVIIKSIDENHNIKEAFKNINIAINSVNKGEIDDEKFKKTVLSHMNKILNDIAFNKSKIQSDIITYEFIERIVENALEYIRKNYGIKYNGSTTKLISSSIMVLKDIKSSDFMTLNEIKKCDEILKIKIPQSYIIGNKIASIIEENLEYENKYILRLFLYLYINSFRINEVKRCNAIIVAHGFSTASSIASVANTMFENFVFEPFDMPMDTPVSTVVKNVRDYLQNVDTKKGTIILVDMGSLNHIYKELKSVVKGDLAIINNISTQLAIDVANKIINKEELEDIVVKASENNKTEYKYYKSETKKKAIIVSCISGIGTAEKLKEIMTKCIGDADIEVISQDFNAIKYDSDDNKVFKQYDVKLIITTAKIERDDVEVIEMQNLINNEGEEKIEKALSGVVKEKGIVEIKKDILKLFSLQNILNQLTILNPNKVIEEVEKIVYSYEYELNMKFPNDLKLVLFIHISVMIERLVLRDEVKSHPNEDNFVECHSDFLNVSKEIFKEVLKEYRVSLPLGEIVIIHEMITMRMQRK
ncbi:sigma-54-dependent transcriptional regulator [Romboutsia weinsteinii]|uniref:Sigma-54-dependent transcriptional regulator n=1 Tax=Romboutsia weinsteinii TaxID=2020949 RepID=A0A371J9M9_9FIRM|nr:sigma-54-dependent transcriptional regulator [Romboutsia weinsteinii]RDY29386.1 sigma-54-dependent transcriptional regulator [Romboutsia weinsteinii]